VLGSGSSEWLVLAGVIVPEENDLALSGCVDALRALLKKPPPNPLHFRKLRRHGQKRAAMALLAKEDLTFSAVAIHKPQISTDYLRQPPHLYNYAARFLAERLSWYADDRGRRLRLFFENRATTSYADLEGYMRWIQDDPDCTIRPCCIDSFQPVSPGLKLAQVADFYASSTFAALEPDEWGFPTPDYLTLVGHQLYRHGQNVLGYGLKIFPLAEDHFDRYPWLGKL
jgi:hypothetical protein